MELRNAEDPGRDAQTGAIQSAPGDDVAGQIASLEVSDTAAQTDGGANGDASKAAGGAADNERLDTADPLRPRRMGQFVMALCRDLDGNLWAGTEDTGVWRCNPNAEEGRHWTQFTRTSTGGKPEPYGPVLPAEPTDADCLGDDCAYALACDKFGRVWVGHLNHGVSVFNGEQWRNYGVLTGPLGERVFAIAANPADGDVWIATNAGLARYRIDQDAWSYYTRAEGLPADDVQCLAFDPKGTLYAGTQCDGLAICEPVRGQRPSATNR